MPKHTWKNEHQNKINKRQLQNISQIMKDHKMIIKDNKMYQQIVLVDKR